MRPTPALNRLIILAAAAAGLVVGVPLAVPSVPAQAAIGTTSWGKTPQAQNDPSDHDQDDSRQGEPSSNGDSQNPTLSHDPTTVTTTCGNGPIIVLPFTITTIHCEAEAEASGRHAAASWS